MKRPSTKQKSEANRGFAITEHKGVRITFANGFSVSIQWGPCNYGSHHDTWDFMAPRKADVWGAEEAEVAVMAPGGGFFRLPGEDDDVIGYRTPADVLEILNKVAAFK